MSSNGTIKKMSPALWSLHIATYDKVIRCDVPYLEQFACLRLKPFSCVHKHHRVIGGGQGAVRVLGKVL